MKLLVSVRDVSEAIEALHGGADIIDVKEPLRGALGKADDVTIAEVIKQVAGRVPVSAAWGELASFPPEAPPPPEAPRKPPRSPCWSFPRKFPYRWKDR